MPDLHNVVEKTIALGGILKKLAATALSAPQSGGAVAVAYSGGLDSRFLIHMAQRNGIAVQALHVQGPHIPSHEQTYAVQWAAQAGVPLTILECDPLSLPEMARNPKDRCYHCKKFLFTLLRDTAGDLPLCDGTNASDLGKYRPGLKALAELAIRSPLAEAGMTKQDIHAIATATGMADPHQASQSCLLTRFGYNTPITRLQLLAVDAAEKATREVFAKHGITDAPFRIRFEDAQTPALHTSIKTIPPGFASDVGNAVEKAGLSGIRIRQMETLSGYFDNE